jgi:hypothetical protein
MFKKLKWKAFEPCLFLKNPSKPNYLGNAEIDSKIEKKVFLKVKLDANNRKRTAFKQKPTKKDWS